MSCCKCTTRTRATAVTNTSGATTITIPSTVTLTAGQVYEIGLFTAIPSGTDGSTVLISNGTGSAYLMNSCGNYFRPLPLRSRTILRVLYLDDPAHFQLLGIRC